MSTIQIRIDPKTKSSAKKVFDELGIEMSAAIKVYLKQVAIRKRLPFELITENGFTVEEEQALLQAEEDARSGRNLTKAMTTKEAVDYLKSL